MEGRRRGGEEAASNLLSRRIIFCEEFSKGMKEEMGGSGDSAERKLGFLA